MGSSRQSFFVKKIKHTYLNSEICRQKHVIKYLYKYIHKGSDRATIVIEESTQSPNATSRMRYWHVDEIKQYFDCHYALALEACWRIFEFNLHSRNLSVERLQYHLENQQIIFFNDYDSLASVLNRPRIEVTMFT